MPFYPSRWETTEYLSEEQARLALAAAWLVRADELVAARTGAAAPDADAHVTWLRTLAGDYTASQTVYGGVAERLGNQSDADFPAPTSNAAYGGNEAPVIQSDGDPVTDALYSNNFALLSLWEGAAALARQPGGDGGRSLGASADLLAAYLSSTQAVSTAHPELSGGWPRAFHYGGWEYHGSAADHGWGPWCLETGWTATWVAAAMALRARNVTMWDTVVRPGATGVDAALFASVCPRFLPPDMCSDAALFDGV